MQSVRIIAGRFIPGQLYRARQNAPDESEVMSGVEIRRLTLPFTYSR